MKIICLEGCSGTGKTTQAHILNDYFSKSPYKHLSVVEKHYEPFKTAVETWYREKGPKVPFSEEDIRKFASARAKTFKNNFKSLENKLDLLILDRYFYTSAVYQSNQNIFPKEIILISKKSGVPTPDITFLFDCNSNLAFNRSDKRNEITGGKHLFSTDATKIQSIKEKYKSLLNFCPEIKTINTEKPIYQITEEIISEIKKILQ